MFLVVILQVTLLLGVALFDFHPYLNAFLYLWTGVALCSGVISVLGVKHHSNTALRFCMWVCAPFSFLVRADAQRYLLEEQALQAELG